MRMQKLLAVVLVLVFPCVGFAAWQVVVPTPQTVAPQTVVTREPFFHTHDTARVFLPAAYIKPVIHRRVVMPNTVYAVSISGSVKDNIERILGRYHWRVVWKAPYDYNFDGRITGSSLPNVIQKLLQPFPLQAVMYVSNRTVAVVPRYPT